MTPPSIEMPFVSRAVENATRPWRVLHACELATHAVWLTEAQLAVGMNPRVLAREFWNAGNDSETPSVTFRAPKDFCRFSSASSMRSHQPIGSILPATGIAGAVWLSTMTS